MENASEASRKFFGIYYSDWYKWVKMSVTSARGSQSFLVLLSAVSSPFFKCVNEFGRIQRVISGDDLIGYSNVWNAVKIVFLGSNLIIRNCLKQALRSSGQISVFLRTADLGVEYPKSEILELPILPFRTAHNWVRTGKWKALGWPLLDVINSG